MVYGSLGRPVPMMKSMGDCGSREWWAWDSVQRDRRRRRELPWCRTMEKLGCQLARSHASGHGQRSMQLGWKGNWTGEVGRAVSQPLWFPLAVASSYQGSLNKMWRPAAAPLMCCMAKGIGKTRVENTRKSRPKRHPQGQTGKEWAAHQGWSTLSII